ncbi:MAG: response regulator [Planctomycetota bacterium]
MPQYRANFKAGGSEAIRRNSLGLDSQKLNALMDILDRANGDAPNLKRTFVRWPFRNESVTFRLIENMGSKREFRVAARNISNGGISLVHNAYIYPDTECEVVLPLHGEDEQLPISGKVTRCQHIRGVVHEVGMSFSEAIDARLFLSTSSMSAYYSLEKIDASKLEGNVLHIEDSALDRRLLAHYMADTRVIIKSAATIEEGHERAQENFDLIMLDRALPDGDGIDFARELRERGILTPIIVLTADTSKDAARGFAEAEVNGLLTKPVDQGTLLRAMTEFLGLNQDGRPSDGDAGMQDLADTFVAELTPMVDQIRAAREAEDAMAAYTVALRIKGTAPSLGYDRLANIADRAASVLAASMSTAESARQLDTLLDACERLKHRRAG